MNSAANLSVKRGLMATLLVGVSLLVYGRTRSFGFSYLDDKQLILDQGALLKNVGNALELFRRTYLGSTDTYYRPVVNLTFMLDVVAGGLEPSGFHLTNTLLHAMNSVLLLRLLFALGLDNWSALAGAGLFVLHPVQVASVAWIPGRNDLLLGSFALLSLLTLLRAQRHNDPWSKLAHGGCFALALFTKETALVLPILFGLALSASGAKRPRLPECWYLPVWFGALVVYLVSRAQVVHLPERYSVESLRVAVAHLPLVLADLGKLCFPFDLKVLGDPMHTPVWPGAVTVSLTIAAVALVRGCRRRILITSVAFALCPLLISLPGTRFVLLDNRLYLPVMGLALLVGEVLRVVGTRTRPVAVGTVLCLSMVCAVCAKSTLARAEKYRDRETFSEAAIKQAPQSSIAMHLRFRNAYQRELEGN